MVLKETGKLVCDLCDYTKRKRYDIDKPNVFSGPFQKWHAIKPQPGDIIEFKRGYFFNHWAIYCDKGYVIHLDNEHWNTSLLALARPVKKLEEPLEKVANGYLCRVNNFDNEAKEKGLEVRPIDEVLEMAHADWDQPCSYSILVQNGSHYVTEWRYAHPFCQEFKLYRDKVFWAYGLGQAGYFTLKNLNFSLPWSG